MAEPPSKRKRVSRACDSCAALRAKCDGVRPICGGCVQNSMTCTWDRPAQKRGPPTGQRLILERKVRNFEAFLGFLWLSNPSAKTDIEAALGLNRFPPDLDTVEQNFSKWGEAEKRAVWQESAAAAWLDARDSMPEEDTKAPAVARARVKDGTELLPTPQTNQDIAAGSYNGAGGAAQGTYPSSSRQPWEPIASWTPSIQHPQSATRTSPLASGDAADSRATAVGQLSPPVIPYTRSTSTTTATDSVVPSTGEARYAPAGDLYGQAGSQRYAGPPSGLYMLRPQNSRSPDDGGAESGEQEGPWVHSQLPSPASSEDGDADAAEEVKDELMTNGPSPKGVVPIAGPSGTSATPNQSMTKAQAQLTLDDLEELDSLLDVYFTHAHSFLPFVDRNRVLRWSSQMRGFSQEPSNEVDKPHPALIFAICAVACGFASQPSPYEAELSPAFKADQRRHARLRTGFIARARDLIMPRLGLEASLDVVQTALLLVICDLSQGRDSRAWVWLAIAIRLGQDIGLHRASAGVTKSPFPSTATKGKGEAQMHPPQPPDAERRRITWWTCFSLDTLLSFHLGRPTAIHRSGFECRVPSSEGADEWELCKTPSMGGEGTGAEEERIAGTGLPRWGGKLGLKPVRSQTLSGFAAFAELSDIMHEIHRLYALPPLVHTPQAVGIVESIRGKLSDWKTKLPAHLSAALEPRTLNSRPGKAAPPTHIFNLALLYYTGVILLHRPFLDAPANHSLHASAITECVQASNALTDVASHYYFAFGPAKAPPFTAYYLLTATTIQLWAWGKRNTVSTTAVERLNQILALFQQMAPHCPTIAKRLHLIQRTLSKRPVGRTLSQGTPSTPASNPPAMLNGQRSEVQSNGPTTTATPTDLPFFQTFGNASTAEDPFALGSFLDFDFTAGFDRPFEPMTGMDDLSPFNMHFATPAKPQNPVQVDPNLGGLAAASPAQPASTPYGGVSFANLFESVRGSAASGQAFDAQSDERSPYDTTALQDPRELLNSWVGHLQS